VATTISTPARQRLCLRIHVDAAVNHGAAQRCAGDVTLDVVRNLVGQLAGRRQYQRPHRVPRRRHAGTRLRQQTLDDGQRESGVLPVPVCAAPITSLPCMTSGIALLWIGVGVV